MFDRLKIGGPTSFIIVCTCSLGQGASAQCKERYTECRSVPLRSVESTCGEGTFNVVHLRDLVS